ncbi:MAG: alpha/beta hydrolase [Rhodospirillales bacterium]|jgi:pimeloyl-ACP methyl ester carboxylesterase|nr:alpha/beta hydrolase [Rhodospirillales bacterium]
MHPRSSYHRILGVEVHVVTWGADTAPPAVLWHGLARTGRDFDDLAAALSDTYRLICPDTPGRGFSQWSAAPDTAYCMASYARLAAGLLDALGLGRVRWVGTSMGGALGILAGATTLRGRLSHLLLNDIGPTLPRPAFERIRDYVGQPPDFATMSDFEAWLRTIYQPFGAHTDAQWRRMAETSSRRLPNGRITTHYDPKIARQFALYPRDFEQWEAYDVLAMPTLVLRGETSDLLLSEVAAAMGGRGPRAACVTVPGCGHAPALNVPAQIGLVRDFLARPTAD